MIDGMALNVGQAICDFSASHASINSMLSKADCHLDTSKESWLATSKGHRIIHFGINNFVK
jgi:hypothetical protein